MSIALLQRIKSLESALLEVNTRLSEVNAALSETNARLAGIDSQNEVTVGQEYDVSLKKMAKRGRPRSIENWT